MVEPAVIERLFRPLWLAAGRLDALRGALKQALEEGGHSGRIVGISGGGSLDPEDAQLAEEAGAQAAGRGAAVLTGGLGGAMEAACRGAKRAGGLTIGILPGADPQAANPYVDLPVATGWREGRNFLVSFLSDGLIAVDGGFGTLSEVALARRLDRPVVELRLPWSLSGVTAAQDARGAVDALWRRLEGASSRTAGAGKERDLR